MDYLARYMLRIKAKHQTLWLMRRYRVWTLDKITESELRAMWGNR